MVIGGFVVQTEPAFTNQIQNRLLQIEEVEVYGSDDKGNIVIVIESSSSDDMESLVKDISSIEGVFSVGLAYLNAEDEVERIEKGEYVPKISFGKTRSH